MSRLRGLALIGCLVHLVLSTIGFGVPAFGVFNNSNVPTFRDGRPWPAGILNGQGGIWFVRPHEVTPRFVTAFPGGRQ